MTKLHPTEPLAVFEASVTAEQVAGFFAAVGWQLPLKPAAPPTLATVFREGEREAIKKLNVPLQNILHGEQKYRFHCDLMPGQSYRGETFISSQYEKKGKAMTMRFFVFQTNLKDAQGTLCVESLTTIIVREKTQ